MDCSWVRPLRPGEVIHELSQATHRHQITCYRLGLCSRRPLGLTVLKALQSLQRKVPHLRLCIQQHDGEMWFREMDSSRVNFVELGDIDVNKEIERQITTPFDSCRGPLWRSVLLVPPPTAPHPLEEKLASLYPHRRTLLLTFHHGITDGFTTVRVCAMLLEILNDLEQGIEIDETLQLGEFSDGTETTRLIKIRKTNLDNDLRRRGMVVDDVKKLTELRPLFTEAFPVPAKEKRNTTLHLTRQLTKDETRKLLTFFKEEKITLNSGFIALANLSLVEMLKKRGYKQKMFDICNFNAINFRRYWKGNSDRALGCHFGPLSLITETPADSYQNFLEYAHDIQTNMQDYIENNRTFDECLYFDVKAGTKCKDMSEFFSNPPEHPHFHHSTTNMGDLKDIFSGEGEYVQIGWLSRHNSFHRFNSTLINSLQTFRGRFLLSLDYNARTVTTAVATEYADTLLRMVYDIVRQMADEDEEVTMS